MKMGKWCNKLTVSRQSLYKGIGLAELTEYFAIFLETLSDIKTKKNTIRIIPKKGKIIHFKNN